MAASSLSPPLCTWLVAACMSVTCERDNYSCPSFINSSKRRRKSARRRKFRSKCSIGTVEFNSGLISSFCGSSIQSLMSSCLAFEPCEEYFSSKVLSSLGYDGFPALLGSKSVCTNPRKSHINQVVHSGVFTTYNPSVCLLLLSLSLLTSFLIVIYFELN